MVQETKQPEILPLPPSATKMTVRESRYLTLDVGEGWDSSCSLPGGLPCPPSALTAGPGPGLCSVGQMSSASLISSSVGHQLPSGLIKSAFTSARATRKLEG